MKRERRKISNKKIGHVSIGVILVIFLFTVDIKNVVTKVSFLDTLSSNLSFLEGLIDKYKTILGTVLIIMLVIMVGVKYQISVSKLSICGIEVRLKNSDKYVINNVKNFLNTKRSLFFINPENDNYYEVLDSYYETYQLLREQLRYYDQGMTSETYGEINKLIMVLNKFLTSYQTNYRHWYEALPKEDLAQKDIGMVQKEYRYNKEITNGFMEINEFMRKFANKHSIDYQKWENE